VPEKSFLPQRAETFSQMVGDAQRVGHDRQGGIDGAA